MQNAMKMVVSLCLCIIIFILGISPVQALAKPGVPLKDKYQDQSTQTTVEFINDTDDIIYYSEVKKEYDEKGYKPTIDQQVIVSVDAIIASDKGTIPIEKNFEEAKNNVLIWTDDCEWFEWDVQIPQEGLYEIVIEYFSLPGTGSTIQREIMIDGQVPFQEASNIPFYRKWENEGQPKKNTLGDEIRPRQIENQCWMEGELIDNQGMYSEPLQFYFSQGNHKIRMNYVNEPVAFGDMIIRSPKIIPKYDEVAKLYKEKGYKEAKKTIKFQGEDAIFKTDPTVRQECNGDPMVEPAAKGNIKLNVLGDWRWRMGGQSVTWNFEVREEGLYKIGVKVGQWWGDGLPVYRQIKIDDRLYFEEMKEYPFEYKKDWRMETLSGKKGNPYLFYLTKGKHQFTMTVKLGPYREIIQDLTNDTLFLSKMIRKIIMITGREPDPNFQYELDKNIPGLLDDLQYLNSSMDKQIDKIKTLSSKKPSIVNNFVLIKRQINEMIRKPDIISRRFEDIVNAQSSIGNWLIDLKNQPLVIDYIVITDPNNIMPVGKSTVLQKIDTTFHNFIQSFNKDYDSIGDIYDGEGKSQGVINIWVSRGKEWVEIMKEMAEEDFTPNSKIKVNMNVLPGGQLNAGGVNTLLLSITSGRAPDVACGLDSISPVEFAIRNAVIDISQFDDYDNVKERFHPGAIDLFKYNNGIFALPETMDFNILIYRRDIINELGISIPQTWDEVYRNVLPILKQNGMDFYFPLGPGGYIPFLYQNNGNFYRNNGLVSNLDSAEAYGAFKKWTELYTNYQLPVQANFFNRMRTGEIPIGVASYWDYVLLSTAAPELYGKWDIAPMPGIKEDHGTINRTAGGALQSAVILKQSDNRKQAWEFIKWWTSTETQARFGKELESLLGVEARWNTANMEAFKQLPWDKDHIKTILEQREWYKEQPIVLGGYFTSRHVNNAWNRVVLGETNVRDSLEKAVKDINKELKAKREQYRKYD